MSATPIQVNLTYTGTAVDGTDFTGVASVTIAAGSNSATFNIATIDDALVEGTENFTVTLGALSVAATSEPLQRIAPTIVSLPPSTTTTITTAMAIPP